MISADCISVWTQIGVHSSNRHPLTSLSKSVWFNDILKSASIFSKFSNLLSDMDLRIESRLEAAGRRSESYIYMKYIHMHVRGSSETISNYMSTYSVTVRNEFREWNYSKKKRFAFVIFKFLILLILYIYHTGFILKNSHNKLNKSIDSTHKNNKGLFE